MTKSSITFIRCSPGTAVTIVSLSLALCFLGIAGLKNPVRAGPYDEAVAMSLATLLRSARAVISEQQEDINDPSKGDKGLTGEAVLKIAKAKYKKATGVDIDSIRPGTVHAELLKAEMAAIVKVMENAQELINQKGVGFKGFLPAVFAFHVSKRFEDSMRHAASIKLTAPRKYVRNRANIPDEWEHDVIEDRFASLSHERGAHFAEAAKKDGKPAYRLILPEYYERSCLACHGEPRGERDITGGKKEGGKLGELGGAISVVIFQ